jgi:carboxyl-terminal processing protease
MEKGKLIVLIDENSASASEIFAGAIQDWDRGLVLGRRSYGKGLVERNYTLPDGSAVRLTTGRYYTPSGRCIQRSYEGGTENYNKDLQRRYEHGEIYSADSIHFADSLKYYTDGKRLVYGGGAIMPDKFYAMDTSFYSEYLRLMNRYGVINYYAGLYFDDNLEELKSKYPNFEQFNKSFTMTDKMFKEMNDMAFARNKIKGSNKDIAISKQYITTQFKAYLARDLYENGAYYRINNTIDKMVIDAANIIKGNRSFKIHGIHE